MAKECIAILSECFQKTAFMATTLGACVIRILHVETIIYVDGRDA